MSIYNHSVRSAGAFAFVVVLSVVPTLARAQQPFASPEAAALALVGAVSSNDPNALTKVLGDQWKRYLPSTDVSRSDVETFLATYAKSNKIVRDGDDRAHLAVGDDDWTLPIPMVQRRDGWRFDARAGGEEMRIRRIGRNELAAMQSSLAYYDAQKEYAAEDRNGDGVLEYAQRIISTPGKRDGLYWAALPGEEASPLGPVFGDDKPGDDYHGYHFKILTGQGKRAPGGSYSYRLNGRMIAGFALVAWPAKYGDTGVMTFILSHDGKLFQKNLGHGTASIAQSMTRFDPDASWTEASP